MYIILTLTFKYIQLYTVPKFIIITLALFFRILLFTAV